MCNLYSLTKGQQAIWELARAMADRTGNLPSMPSIFPDYRAPIVRNTPDGRELAMARWGMPSPQFVLKGRNSDPGVTNVRNVASPHWRRWLGLESRCVVPFTSFSEHQVMPDGSRPPVWFALDDSRPLACFAGICTQWTSVRKVREGETTNDIFAFLTTEPNAEVGAVHPKAMPVILRTAEEIDVWLTAPTTKPYRCSGLFPMVRCGSSREVRSRTLRLQRQAPPWAPFCNVRRLLCGQLDIAFPSDPRCPWTPSGRTL
jgi:putative SOS response-associated peptidase YedK